jgi:segregation and condensation protein B
MKDTYVKNVVEAALLAAGKPVSHAELEQLFEGAQRPSGKDIERALAALRDDYAGRAIELHESASGTRIQVRRDFGAAIARLWPERPQRYTRALLETLALIAYRQPITRAEIEAVRGVTVSPNTIRTLLDRNWIRVVGHRDLPGRPEILGTTREFLDYFGLRTLDELPPLAELRLLSDADPQLALPGTAAIPLADSGDDLPIASADDGLDGDEESSGADDLQAAGAHLVAAPPITDD